MEHIKTKLPTAEYYTRHNSIAEWYADAYNDKIGADFIRPSVTFADAWDALQHNTDGGFYPVTMYLNRADSVVRERIFSRLCDVYGVDYDIIYNLWLI